MQKFEPTPIAAFTEPMNVSVIDGEVVIIGPAWLHAAFSPDAARVSAERLSIAADKAEAQRKKAGL